MNQILAKICEFGIIFQFLISNCCWPCIIQIICGILFSQWQNLIDFNYTTSYEYLIGWCTILTFCRVAYSTLGECKYCTCRDANILVVTDLKAVSLFLLFSIAVWYIRWELCSFSRTQWPWEQYSSHHELDSSCTK